MRTLAVIPARSGSKGLVNKNIKPLMGKPLMAYSIEAAIESHVADVVHVSTDSGEYAEIGKRYGGDVPFLRDSSVAGDTATTWETIEWVLQEYEGLGEKFDTVMVLQPTSPLRDSNDIKNAMRLYLEKGARSVISVCEAEHSPRWMNTLPESGSLNQFIDETSNGPRQKMNTYYRLNGAIYIVDIALLKNHESLYGPDSYAYIMERNHSVDIDEELDFVTAEAIMNKL